MQKFLKFRGCETKIWNRRRLKKKDLISKLDDESTVLFDPNIIENCYPNRPDILRMINLHNFVAWYDYSKHPCLTNTNHENSLKLKNNFGYLHKRSEA